MTNRGDRLQEETGNRRFPVRPWLFIVAIVIFVLMNTAIASAASWDTAKIFAPKDPSPPNPPTWAEDVQLGGVSGMAINMTGAGGVNPGTVYTAGFNAGEWHAARYSDDGEFELAWTSTSHCGPKAAVPSTCLARPSGVSGGVDIAVDQVTGNVFVFYKNQAPKVVQEYKADGTGPIAEFGELDPAGTATSSPGKLHGSPSNENIAVDDSGAVYVSDEDVSSDFFHRLMVFRPQTPGDYEHYVYAGQSSDIAAGFLPSNPPFRPTVDSAGNVYVAGETYIEKYDPAQPATAICKFSLPTGGITSMTVNPATGAPFYYSFKDRKVHQLSPCNAQGKFVEKDSEGAFVAGPPFSPVPQRSNIEAMAFNPLLQFSPDRSSGALYAGAPEACPSIGSCPPAAEGQSSLGYIFAPQVSLKPTVISESVTQVGQTSATVNAKVNPKGSQTSYVFQYLTDAAYQANDPSDRFAGAMQVPSGVAVLGNGQQPLLASVAVSGLSPATAYRFRVVATNEEGTIAGAAEIFQTFPLEAEALPDGRAYELVSPSQKNGGEVLPAAPGIASCGTECKPGLTAQRFPVQVSPSGDSVAYQGSPFGVNEGATEFDEYIATRGSSGWQSISLSPSLEGDSGGAGFKLFSLSSELSSAVVFARNQALVPDAPPGYLNFFGEQSADRFSLDPLVTNTNASLHRASGEGPNGLKLTYVGASADFSRQFFEANDALTGASASTPAAADGGATKFNLYEWSGGQLHLVNVQPLNIETIPGATFGSGFELSTGESQPPADFSHAISTDGSRVFWTSATGHLFVRIDGNRTLEIPGPGTCKPSVPRSERSCFVTASADGMQVLLSNGQVYAFNEGTELYEAAIDLTAGKGGFQGLAGQSDDLSHVYFVMGPAEGTGDLTIGSTSVANVQTKSGSFSVGQTITGVGIPAGTTITVVGSETLQLSSPATLGGAVSLSAQMLLAGEEANSAGARAQVGGFNLYSWHNGTVVFVGTLLAGDNKALGVWKAYPVERSAEASPDGRWLAFNSEAELTGANSMGACDFDSNKGEFIGPAPCEEVYLYDSQSDSLRCPSCNPAGAAPLGDSLLRKMTNAQGFLAQPRYLTNDGRLYFDSRDSLSGLDTNNGVEDVYQYEPSGIGSCLNAGGCVSLISSGRGAYDSNFLAMDSTGGNVFFTTRQRLVPRDQDALLDLYDARVGGGIAAEATVPPPECLGEACQPAPPAQNELFPASSSFEGSGNSNKAPGCKKGQVKRKGRCVKKPKHQKPKSGGKKARHRTGSSK